MDKKHYIKDFKVVRYYGGTIFIKTSTPRERHDPPVGVMIPNSIARSLLTYYDKDVSVFDLRTSDAVASEQSILTITQMDKKIGLTPVSMNGMRCAVRIYDKQVLKEKLLLSFLNGVL